MPLSNPVPSSITLPKSSTITAAAITAAATNTQLLAPNSNRIGATIFNRSTSNLYIKLGGTATTTVFSVRIDPSGYYETPFNYTGAIAGIWDAANGAALVEEFS